jgi:pyruvate dehydrogenase E2 component (dihydrolipoamide acetyltransferase)
MPTKVIMPALGVAQQTGKLLKWLKSEGGAVVKGEPLMEIETDKATVEIESPASGVLAQVVACEGDEVPVGEAIAVILAPGENLNVDISQSGPSTSRKAEAIKTDSVRPIERRPASPPGAVQRAAGEDRLSDGTHPRRTGQAIGSLQAPNRRLLASPAAKRIARELGVDLSMIRGTGPEGSVLAEDVRRAGGNESKPIDAAARRRQTVPLTPMRRTIGERMTASKQTAPHFYLHMEIDMTAVGNYRSVRRNADAGVVPSVNDCILYATARALQKFPVLNSSFVGDAITVHDAIHLGMAVALDEGLVVPVIRDADRCSLPDLTSRTRELVDRAQHKKLLPRDYEDGTFTVSNLGMLGVDSFIAIINPPQCAILAVGRIAPRVVADDGMYAIKPLLTATLSADHRIVDGALAARFLKQIKETLERGEF